MKARLSALPPGLAGTDKTLREIARLIADDLKNQRLRVYGSNILRALPNKDYLAEAKAIYRYVASHIRFQRDPIGIETVQSPLFTLRLGVGDCDDQAALVAALALAVGLPARLRAVGYSPDNLSHIWAEIFAGDRWYPADTTEPGRGFGWRPKKFPVERIYDFNGKVVGMAQLAATLPVKRGDMQEAIKAEVFNVLTTNWQAGLINDADVAGYQRVIEEGNFPTKEPLLVDPVKAALAEFRSWAPSHLAPSRKPIGTLSGMEGLSGFLSSIWNGVKKVVGTVVGVAAKAVGITSEKPIVIQPTVSIPAGAVQTTVTPAAAQAGVMEFLKSPVVLIAGAAILFLLFRGQSGRRR
jgi:hypothetical protein